MLYFPYNQKPIYLRWILSIFNADLSIHNLKGKFLWKTSVSENLYMNKPFNFNFHCCLFEQRLNFNLYVQIDWELQLFIKRINIIRILKWILDKVGNLKKKKLIIECKFFLYYIHAIDLFNYRHSLFSVVSVATELRTL